MAPTYDFSIIDNCLKCAFREDRLFCDVSDEVLRGLQAVKVTSVYPKGTLLCLEGQPPRGIFILCTGRAKLFTSSSEGKTVILRIAEPGEVLGLTAVIGDTPYEATVETIEPSQANFISRADFLRFMGEHRDVGMKVAQQLTHNCKCAYDEIRSLGLSGSVPEKMAKLLLSWAVHPLPARKESPEIAIRVTLTQEEIAQLTGTARETVSRVLRVFKKNGWLRIKGATWFLLKKEELEKLVTT